MTTILLLICSNVFMTFAWYGHLKYGHAWPLWKAIVVSWAIALLEYCLAVPANRLGYGQFSGFQLKIIQEVVTLIVFVGFAVMFLKEKLAWNYLVAFAFLGGAVFFAFAFQAPAATAPNVRAGVIEGVKPANGLAQIPAGKAVQFRPIEAPSRD
jgi:hypothetical protein